MSSLRLYLIIVILSIITLINFLAALQGYRNAMLQAQDLLDSHLEQYLQLLVLHANKIEQTPLKTSAAPADNRTELIYQIIDNEGQILSRSANAPGLALQITEPGHKDINHAGYRWHAITELLPDKGIRISVAQRADLRYQIAESLALQSVIPILLGIPILAMILLIIINTGLKPIHRLTQQLHQRKASRLNPITIENVPKELLLLTTSINALLTRLQAAFEREKRFASDAAHELRTPIAALNIHLQNTLIELVTPPESIRKAQLAANRLSHIVEQILILNRTAPEQYMAQRTLVDLFDVIKRSIENHIEYINKKQQHIAFEGTHGALLGDPFSLEILVNNLLDNAIKYTPEKGELLISLKQNKKQLILSVIDNGTGIPEDQHQRVFERFYRLDGDRHRTTNTGCGLGLSIVKHIVDLHEACIEFAPSSLAETGLCVSIIFPETICHIDNKEN